MAKLRLRVPASKYISKLLYASHGLILVFALGFSLCALFTHRAEMNSLKDFKLEITTQYVYFYYATTGCVALAAGIGIAAQLKGNKAFFWILYCGILGIMSLVELAVGGSALSKLSNEMQGIKTQLHKVIEVYRRDDENKSPLQDAWDEAQKKYKCCGLNNYTDWQSVQFGRTSLTVPTSCCNEKTREDKYCGINILPIHPNASDIINPDGCFKKLVEDIDLQLHVMGYFGVIVALFQIILVGTVSYLLVSKKM